MRLESFLWPACRMGEAIDAVVRAAGLSTPGATDGDGEPPTPDIDLLQRWCDAAAASRHLEAEPVHLAYENADQLPTPLLLAVGPERNLLAIASGSDPHVILVASDGRRHRVDRRVMAKALREPLEISIRADVDGMLAAAKVQPSRLDSAFQTIAAERLRGRPVAHGWHFRPDPGRPVSEMAVHRGIRRQCGWLLGAHAAQYAIWLMSWWVIGRGGLEGHLDWGWVSGWMLALATLVPLHVCGTWLQGSLGVSAASLLKERLMAGSLRSDPEAIRSEGVGHLLGRVIEAEAVESLALGGGLLAILSVLDLAFAVVVLFAGVAGAWHAAVMVGVGLLAATVAIRYHRRRVAWAEARLHLTHDFVERIAGHRTRLVQEDPAKWHDTEDQDLASYLSASERMDRLVPVLLVAVPRMWLALAVVVTVPAFLTGTSSGRLAITMGGILIVHVAWRHLTESLVQISGAAIAWQQVQPLVSAATNLERIPAAVVGATDRDVSSRLLHARDLVYRYPSRTEPAVHGATLDARTGDRLLLEGPSGGGKSTFASLLAGLRLPDAGLLLVRGLDRRTLGHAEWRRRVVASPQFHENHVVSETLMFNLLMGRQWPPTEADVADALDVCRELGLEPLIQRMPAGLLQMVGESGWQLSHGEKSRVFIARALLQRGDLTIFDESFAALDPDNLRTAVECVLKRAPTLLVVAHP